MEKKDLMRKQELAEELGMKFDEAAELFSEETLGTMRLLNTVGGNDEDGVYLVCFGAKDNCDSYGKCVGSNCSETKTKDSSKNDSNCGVNVTIAPPPTVPPTPLPYTLPDPTLPPYLSPTIDIPDIR